MYCRKCGKQLEDGVKFCPNCGTAQSAAGTDADKAEKQGAAAHTPKPSAHTPKPSGTASDAGAPNRKKPEAEKQVRRPLPAADKKGAGKNPIVLLGAAAAVLVIALIAFFATRKPTLSLSEFVTVHFEGVDGYGKARYQFDGDTALAYIAGKKKLKQEQRDAMQTILETPDIVFSKNSGLSNGEKISVVCSLPEVVAKTYGFKLSDKECVFEVSGLKEVQDVDAMEMLRVTFSGASPHVAITKELDETHPLYPYLDWDAYYELPYETTAKNGEVCTLSLKFNEEKALLDGYRVINTSRDYELEDLGTYDYTLESADAENLQELIAEGKAASSTYIQENENSFLREEGCSSGFVIWSRAKGALDRIVKMYYEKSYTVNRTALVYRWSLPVMNPDETITEHTAYMLYDCDNIIENTDGTLAYENGWCGTYYLSEAAVGEELTDMPGYLWSYETEETGEEVPWITTEAINENAEEELAQEAFPQPEQAVPADYADVKAPEIDTQFAAQAVATTEWNGHRYYLFDENVTWKEAKRQCEQMGGTLASVTGWTEQCVLNALCEEGETGYYWIGATDQAFEGNWTWVTGEPFAYTFWRSGQPDNDGSAQHYAYMGYYYDWQWDDADSEESGVGYILELAAESDGSVLLNDTDLLLDMEYAETEDCLTDTYGNRHYGLTYLNADENGWAAYDLKGNYARLTGKVAVYENADSEASMDLAIFGDGKLLYRTCARNRLSAEVPFEVDVTGVKYLTFAARNPGNSGNARLLLPDLKLYRAEEMTADAQDRLFELPIVEGVEERSPHRTWRDRDGLLHEGHVYLEADQKDTVTWNLNGAYTEFSGRIAAGNRQSAGAQIAVRIYGDDELLFELKDWNWMQEGVDFKVDVTGCRLLRVETEDTAESYDAGLVLTDDCLVKAVPEEPEKKVKAETEAPVLSLGTCVLGSQLNYNGHHYYLIETQMTWEAAKKYCEEQGGHLAVITSPVEQRCVEALLKNRNSYDYWIGATDKGHEGTWTWVTGEPFAYTCWNSGQPDNYGEKGEPYLQVYGDGGWNDNAADEEFGFILEISNDQNNAGASQELRELENAERFVSSSAEYQESARDTQGNRYFSSYRLRAYDNAAITIDLNGEYTEFTGSFTSCDGNYSNTRADVAVYGDGRQLFAKSGIYGWGEAIPFAIDVTGVKTLTIRSGKTAGYDAGCLLINDSRLTLAEAPAECAELTRLADLQQIDGNRIELRQDLLTDSYGGLHDGSMKMETYDNGYGVYLLGGNYTELSGAITAGPRTGSGTVHVEIYGDNELLFEQDGIGRRTEAVPFALDVTGVNNLKITVSDDDSENSGETIYLVDDSLK